MIEIDDAGNGCPILGEVFAARRMETGDHAAVYVPLPSETSVKIPKEDYIMSLLTQLNVPKNETVLLCRGNTLNGFENQLQQKGFEVKRGKVSEQTDKIAETLFMDQLYSIGFPKDLSLSNREYREFYEMVKIWYISLYAGSKNLFKSGRKRPLKTREYMHNPVYHFPNVLRKLFYL
ncbi:MULTISPECIES: hypothetical protein [Fictibacillus]|uniref:Uncharacterized protein n=1 Tax=Fictibacillus terranigra TaxID=3058424 RepID=A0ABT8EAX9_9BACL|nr:hypothetical protein [Fictibacillus sp. CENA-BCM004]MDN4075019.1 hypothetical protein [Fictibacillus sp. CENA-BCM004]